MFRLAVSDSGGVWRVERGKKLLNKDLKLIKSLLPEKYFWARQGWNNYVHDCEDPALMFTLAMSESAE